MLGHLAASDSLQPLVVAHQALLLMGLYQQK